MYAFCTLQWYAGSPVDVFGNVTEVVYGVGPVEAQIAVTVLAAIGWFVLLGVVVLVILLLYRHKKKKKERS